MCVRNYLGSVSVANPPTGTEFNVVIVYDGRAAARRAVQMIDRLKGELGWEFELQPVLWRFDLLIDPVLAAAASADSAKANLLVVATDNCQELPAETKEWLQSAIAQMRRSPAAVAALLDSGTCSPHRMSAVCRFLKTSAERFGRDFFCSNPMLSGTADSGAIVGRGDACAADTSIKFRESIHWRNPARWWGLNE